MGMFSEITTEGTVRQIVQFIEIEMQHCSHDRNTIKALKAVGRKALDCFEWDSPKWANKYDRLFKE